MMGSSSDNFDCFPVFLVAYREIPIIYYYYYLLPFSPPASSCLCSLLGLDGIRYSNHSFFRKRHLLRWLFISFADIMSDLTKSLISMTFACSAWVGNVSSLRSKYWSSVDIYIEPYHLLGVHSSIRVQG